MNRLSFCISLFSSLLFFSFSFAGDLPDTDYDTSKIVLFPINKAVISSEIEGSIKQYNFKEGEIFNKGDIIAVFDDGLYRNGYDEAKAQYEQSLANYRFVENIYDNNKKLFDKGGLSVQEFEKFKLEKANALSQMQIAKASMNVAQIKLDDCTIKAPFSGRLTEKLVNEHEFVGTGTPIMEVINDSELLAIMYLPSDGIKKIKKDSAMSFIIDETGNKYEGKVYEISGYIYSGSRTFEIKAVIDNKDRELFSGMSGSLLTDTGR